MNRRTDSFRIAQTELNRFSKAHEWIRSGDLLSVGSLLRRSGKPGADKWHVLEVSPATDEITLCADWCGLRSNVSVVRRLSDIYSPTWMICEKKPVIDQLGMALVNWLAAQVDVVREHFGRYRTYLRRRRKRVVRTERVDAVKLVSFWIMAGVVLYEVLVVIKWIRG